jgi:hypothetical protein
MPPKAGRGKKRKIANKFKQHEKKEDEVEIFDLKEDGTEFSQQSQASIPPSPPDRQQESSDGEGKYLKSHLGLNNSVNR